VPGNKPDDLGDAGNDEGPGRGLLVAGMIWWVTG